MPTWLVTTDDILIFWIGAGKQGLLWSRGKTAPSQSRVRELSRMAPELDSNFSPLC